MVDPQPGPSPDEPVLASSPLANRPGFLVRRLHQIFTAIYLQSCKQFGTTPVQSSVLQVLLARPGLDQAGLAAEIGLDRTTTSLVLGRLQARKLLRREVDRDDRRSRRAYLTNEGEALIREMHAAIDEAHGRLMAPLDEMEVATFMDLLKRLVAANNEHGRAALRSI